MINNLRFGFKGGDEIWVVGVLGACVWVVGVLGVCVGGVDMVKKVWGRSGWWSDLGEKGWPTHRGYSGKAGIHRHHNSHLGTTTSHSTAQPQHTSTTHITHVVSISI